MTVAKSLYLFRIDSGFHPPVIVPGRVEHPNRPVACSAQRAALPIPQVKRDLNHLGLRRRALDGTNQQQLALHRHSLAVRDPSFGTSVASRRSSPLHPAGHGRGEPAQVADRP